MGAAQSSKMLSRLAVQISGPPSVSSPPQPDASALRFYVEVIGNIRREVSADSAEFYGVRSRREWRDQQIEAVRHCFVRLSGGYAKDVILRQVKCKKAGG